MYENIVHRFAKTRDVLWQFTVKFYDLIKDKPSFILDAGCGNGRNMIYPHTYVGLDLSSEFFDYITYNKCHTIKGNITSLSYRDEVFDHIICIATLHHLDANNHVKALNELLRVTKKGGLICLSVWYPPNIKNMQKDHYQIYNKTDVIRYFYIFDKGEIDKLIIDNNLNTKCEIIESNIYKQSQYLFLKKI